MSASAFAFLPTTTLTARLWRQGYRPDPPLDLPEAVVLADAEAWSEGICEHCGHVGLTVQPWHRGESYKATATCPRCKYGCEV